MLSFHTNWCHQPKDFIHGKCRNQVFCSLGVLQHPSLVVLINESDPISKTINCFHYTTSALVPSITWPIKNTVKWEEGKIKKQSKKYK